MNSKTNHAFTFEISVLPNKETIEASTEEFLKQRYPDASVTVSDVDDWRTELSHNLDKWLFCYQPHYDENKRIIEGRCGSYHAYLHDVNHSFSMSHEISKKYFIDKIVDSLDSVIAVSRCLSVFLRTQAWYEGIWDDLILEGDSGSVFIHFGVSD